MLVSAVLLSVSIQHCRAQEVEKLQELLADSTVRAVADTLTVLAGESVIQATTDSIIRVVKDSILQKDDAKNESVVVLSDQKAPQPKPKRDWATWKPNPKRALWLALVIPGGGQIYNRKYWKLPLVYGGFLGCIYAMTWNNSMYKDYSQAYLDLMDADPGTQSYNLFLHSGVTITDANKERYKDIFKKRKDKYRRWRDLSFFVMVGVYALSVIDAYVDAELSVFDISKDLSLKVEPTILNNHSSGNMLDNSSVGLQCSLNF